MNTSLTILGNAPTLRKEDHPTPFFGTIPKNTSLEMEGFYGPLSSDGLGFQRTAPRIWGPPIFSPAVADPKGLKEYSQLLAIDPSSHIP